MPRRRRPWIHIAFGVALGLVLTGLTSRTSAQRPTSPSQPSEARTPAASEASPRFVSFIQRLALAEIATLFGIPLAVVGLLFTALATRDTALQQQVANKQLEATLGQLRLAEQAAQPEVLLNGHLVPGGSPERPARFDRLSLEVRGAAKDVSTTVNTAIVMERDLKRDGLTYIDWWKWAGAGAGEAARWTSSPRLLSGLDSRRQKNFILLFTIIEVTYRDVFGKFHIRYFGVIEVLGTRSAYSVNPDSITFELEDPEASVSCQSAVTIQRKRELGTSSDGVARTPTKVYAKLAQGQPITLADVQASITLNAPEECRLL